MAEFTPINTQEEFDKAIKGRLAQKDRELEEKYRDYLAPDKVDALKEKHAEEMKTLNDALKDAKDKIAGHDKEKADLLSRASKAETSLLKSKIASKHHIPIELAERLTGDTEEDIEKDAESFAGYMGNKSAAPGYTREPAGALNDPHAATQAAYSALLASLSGND